MKPIILIPALCAALITSPAVFAKSGKHHKHNDRIETHARVTHVEPIYRTKVTRSPREECHYEDVSYRDHGHTGHTAGKMIVGGLVGSAIANEVHGGTNAKIAGAVVGSAIGHEMGSRPRSRHHQTQERCHTVRERHNRRYIDGYRVHYQYHGSDFVTRMKERPGRRIRVFVNVEPAHHRH